MKLNQINSSAIITGRCPNHLGGVVARALCAVVLLVGFVLLGGIEAEAQKPHPWSLRPDNQIGGPAGGLPESQPFHNTVRNRTWCEVQTESWGALGRGIFDTGHFVADAGYGFIQVGVSLTGYYLPNPPNPSGFFNLTQGDAVRALVEGPFIALDDIFTGDGQKACHTLGGALAFAPIGMLRRGKCGKAEAPLPPSLPTAKPPPGVCGRIPSPSKIDLMGGPESQLDGYFCYDLNYNPASGRPGMVGDVFKMPFESGSVGEIVCTNPHPGLSASLRDATGGTAWITDPLRVLSPEGRLIVNCAPANPAGSLSNYMGRYLRELEKCGDIKINRHGCLLKEFRCLEMYRTGENGIPGRMFTTKEANCVKSYEIIKLR